MPVPNGHPTPTDGETTWPENPVARVNSVAPASPAAESVSLPSFVLSLNHLREVNG